MQTAVLSLIAIRRLRFPLNDQSANPESNFAAHTLLAALALTGVACLRDEGYDLRSRCLLVPNNPPIYEMVPADGSAPVSFSLSARNAKDIFAQSVEEVRKCGLPWTESKIVLQPAPKLIQLIQKSRDAQNSAQPE